MAETNNNYDLTAGRGDLINLFLGHNQLTGILDVSKCRGLIILDVSVGVDRVGVGVGVGVGVNNSEVMKYLHHVIVQ